jgi:hypothetical protein
MFSGHQDALYCFEKGSMKKNNTLKKDRATGPSFTPYVYTRGLD